MSMRARHNFSQYNRQDLWGGHYGLVDSLSGAMALSATDALLIRPDYWISFLFKRTLGPRVHNATSSDRMVRAYAFSGAPPSGFAAPQCGGGGAQLVLINLNSAPVRAALAGGGAGAGYAAWSLTAGAGGVFGGDSALNGVALPGVADVAKVDPATFLGRIGAPPVTGAGDVALPAASITFVCLSK